MTLLLPFFTSYLNPQGYPKLMSDTQTAPIYRIVTTWSSRSRHFTLIVIRDGGPRFHSYVYFMNRVTHYIIHELIMHHRSLQSNLLSNFVYFWGTDASKQRFLERKVLPFIRSSSRKQPVRIHEESRFFTSNLTHDKVRSVLPIATLDLLWFCGPSHENWVPLSKGEVCGPLLFRCSEFLPRSQL